MSKLHPKLVSQQPLDILIGGHSDAGKKSLNGDAFAVHRPQQLEVNAIKGVSACLADGASCSDHAQEASHTAVSHFINDYYSTPDYWGVKKSAAKVINALNSWLYQHQQFSLAADSDLPHNKLLTTFSGIIFKSNYAHLFHVGDSRIYRLRDGRFEQLSRDHVLKQGKQQFLRKGLGLEQRLELDYLKEQLLPLDFYLICSDGFYDWLKLGDYVDQFNLELEDSQLETLAQRMVNDAIANGSGDNVSCVILKVNHVPDPEFEESYQLLEQLVIPPALEAGNKLDHFEIISTLYSGPRSHVYLATDLQSHTQCVIKAPSQNFDEDEHYLESFMREQWVGRRLNHPAIMKIFPRPATSPFLYHVSEYLEGITLRQWMYDNPSPSLDKVRNIVEAIVVPLRVFQRHGLVHRDLKPENIVIDETGKISLIDFGAVQIDGLMDDSSQRRDEIPLGAQDYMAPEYRQTGLASHSSDIYSLGVIVYEMLVGKLPYKLLNPGLQARHSDYIFAHKQRRDIPLWLDLALEKACNPLAEYRYPSLSEFSHDLFKPNQVMVDQFEMSPLIKRNPLLFWQGTSAVLAAIVIIQWLSQ